MNKNQRGFAPFLIIGLVVLVLAAAGGTGYYLMSKNKQVACTMEAKICPDGSSVGRTGPKCEFAACPVSNDETSNWKTYTNNEYGFEVKYKPDWEVVSRKSDPFEMSFVFQRKDHPKAEYGTVSINIGTGDAEYLKNLRNRWDKDFAPTQDYNILGGTGFKHGAYEFNLGGVILTNGTKIFYIERNYNGDISEKDFDQFLSTFKFTDTTN